MNKIVAIIMIIALVNGQIIRAVNGPLANQRAALESLGQDILLKLHIKLDPTTQRFVL